ncbi:MAG: ATPase [Deltaproteobacteria bacterium]|nr:ATPase [Deltaproteobacteria bacterium]
MFDRPSQSPPRSLEALPSSTDPRPAALLERRVQIVAGKGGVGKSVLASALALRSAQAGHRTLLLEVNGPDATARVLRVKTAPDEPREVRDRLWLCRMTPAGALREYALMVLRFKALYHLVFENRLVRYLLRSIPGLGEFTMMGKAWYHSTETDGALPRFDRLVIDAPATGHAITFLSVARVVADTVPDGVMKDAAEKMARLVEDPEGACLHVAALPEEMAVNEALHLASVARVQLRVATGIGFLNRMLTPLLAPGEARVLDGLTGPLAPYARAVQRRLAWEEVQADFAARFRDESGMPVVVVPDVLKTERDDGFVESVIASINESVGPSRPARLTISPGRRRE